MTSPGPRLQQSPAEKSDRIESWKEISAYLRRDVTTVQRWEKRERMPVHRHLHDKQGTVYAFRHELDTWMRGRNLSTAPETISSPPRKTSLSIALAMLLIGTMALLWVNARRWRDPLLDARYHVLTDFAAIRQDAAISRDGQFVAFLSDRDGIPDLWVTQIASREFHNLTRGAVAELLNPSLRTLEFSPDGSLVTFWTRHGNDIGVWSVPTLGGQPRPYLERVAEYDWSPDGKHLAYHTPAPGDPLFVTNGAIDSSDRPIFTAPPGQHAHFPRWSPDNAYIYFVLGALPDQLDIFRIRPTGGPPERLTSHHSLVSYPAFLDSRTLLYLAARSDGSGPFLYALDLVHRISHLLSPSPDRYTSLSASADGRHLVATQTSLKSTVWQLHLSGSTLNELPISTPSPSNPRLGSDFLLFTSDSSAGSSIWRLQDGAPTEIWHNDGSHLIAAPAISPDGQQIAFSIHQSDRTLLYLMHADGSGAHAVSASLPLEGSLAWSPDSHTIATSVLESGAPHLFRFPLNGQPPSPLVREYSRDPEWSPDGDFLLYSGPDIGTDFTVKAVRADGSPQSLPPITLTRGARHLLFADHGHTLLLLRGDIHHKDLWQIDLRTGAARQITHLSPGFDVTDFDASPDLTNVLLERSQERSEVVLIDLHR